MSKYKIGLALSGGAIRGVAHLGVLKAMEEYGLAPGKIAGVSAGAIVGALYADGRSVQEILDFFENSSFNKRVKFQMPKLVDLKKSDGFHMPKFRELVKYDGYKDYLAKTLKARRFSDLRIPLVVNATDLQMGEIAYFDSGELLGPVVASASVPFVFEPAVIGGKSYVDGGILCNLPAEVLRNECDLLIGVHCNPIWPDAPGTKYGWRSLADRTIHLAVNGNTAVSKHYCDIVIEMRRDRDVGMFEASQCEYLLQNGYQSAIDAFRNFDFEKFGIHVNKI